MHYLLMFQINFKEKLKNTNYRLEEENEKIRILRNRLDDKESEKRLVQNQQDFFEKQVSNLKSENQTLRVQLKNAESNLNNILAKSKDQFLAQSANGETEYVTQKEWNMMSKIRSLEAEVVDLQKEKDKYYLKYYEINGLKGELDKEELDDSVMEMVDLKYQNNLQIAETKEKQLKNKLSTYYYYPSAYLLY